MKNRRDFTKTALMAAVPAVILGPTGQPLQARGAASAKREFKEKFLASGAAFRFSPHGGHGRPWTSELEKGYESFKKHPDVCYAVKNLRSGGYKATHQADNSMHGGSMPKPAVAACVLEKKKGDLTREEFQHIVNVCDRSINASWQALLSRFTTADEQAFERKYGLPDVGIRANYQTPRFYCEFFQRCVSYRLDYGCELLLEAMRRSQFGAGRWYLPRSISYVGGKTGTSGGFKNEGLFFKKGGSAWAIVVYTKSGFGSGGNIWKMGALFGGLYREYIG